MPVLLVELILTLVVILIAAELFTNALEHLGERLRISDGVTGSLLAAVGTAMPETMIPLLAILGSARHEPEGRAIDEEIGVGAILGAPLMLSTLSTFLMTASVLGQRGLRGRVAPEHTGFARDLNYFVVAFVLAAVAMYVPHENRAARATLGLGLIAVYLAYVCMTVRASGKLVEDGHGTEAGNALHLGRLRLPVGLWSILIQLALGAALLIGGAEGFIHSVRGVSAQIGVSPLLLSLLIVPIATELPEKVNSILWIRRGKDTLAFGNITGAMVFQGTLLPAIGILLTPWEPRLEVLTGVLVTLAAALWMRLFARPRGLPVWALLANGGLYAAYLSITLSR